MLLAETAWLQEHLDDPGLRIIDCEPLDAYQRAHIPGAVGLRVNNFIKDSHDPVHVMPPEEFAQLMGSLGVGPETTVVAYDARGTPSARMWWVLNYYGHTKVKVLNGGWNAWFAEGRPSTMEVPQVTATTFPPRVNDSLLCILDYGVARVGKEEAVFLDVRSEGEWAGEADRGNRRSGHIPAAVHLEWLSFITDDATRRLKPAHELRAMLAQAGVTPQQEVITY